ncbi:transcriptional regulator GcvA [Azospirillum lipoferum]|uniref:Transcriptional regulator GcvA n=2 Tax=Azospirillaceae TaxID=2829815 RepID=A0A5A9GMR3_AZOLI|nr:transcriptional regulator GcvA [Azospirillum lipoferum]
MSYRMPPLNALRAFEASARHLSFKLAANELNVTAGAVSQHVKSLEDLLGVKLFRRLHKSLALTQAGQSYLPALRNAFSIISESTQRIAVKRSVEVFSIGVQAAFAVKWLFPRLPLFLDDNPHIDVRLSSSIELEEVRQGLVDAVIRYGTGHFPGFRSILIRPERLDPVCSPRLLANGPPLEKLEDLRHHLLLHDEFRESWRIWCAARDMDGLDFTKGLSFADEHLALKAAIEGFGVALGQDLLIEEDVRSGRLVRPLGDGPERNGGYYLVCSDSNADCAKMKTFREFLASGIQVPDLFEADAPAIVVQARALAAVRKGSLNGMGKSMGA